MKPADQHGYKTLFFGAPMLKFLSSRKSVAPLTDLHSIARWIDDLPIGDGVQTIEALARQIKEYNDEPQPLTKDRLAILNTLDERAQDLLALLRAQYLQNPRMSRVVESRLWNTVSGFYQEILRAYHTHIMEYIANPNASKIAAQIPLMTVRALNYFGLDAIWSCYRYTAVNSTLWKRVHNLYHFAEYEEFDCQPQKLYPEDEGVTSVSQAYLQILMLETLNTGSLTPRQIHLIERWLPTLLQGMEIAREFKPARHVFYVKLNENKGARRVRRVISSEHHRYWDTYGLKDKLDFLRAQLSAGRMPAQLGLTEDCRLPACLDLLERIAYFWAPVGVKRLQRAFERQQTVKSIEVLRGLKDICINVRADGARSTLASAAASDELSYAEMVDVHLYGFVTKRTQGKTNQEKEGIIEYVPAHERWVMQNESEMGYGAHIDDQAEDWIRLGKLVGLKPEKKGHWNVGVIRRLRRCEANQRYVGIEVIAEHPVSLMLRPEKTQQRALSIVGVEAVDVVRPIPGLYIKAKTSQHSDSLILQSAEFATGRELWFTVRSIIYHLRLKRALERGDDWLRASFEVLGKHVIERGQE